MDSHPNQRGVCAVGVSALQTYRKTHPGSKCSSKCCAAGQGLGGQSAVTKIYDVLIEAYCKLLLSQRAGYSSMLVQLINVCVVFLYVTGHLLSDGATKSLFQSVGLGT